MANPKKQLIVYAEDDQDDIELMEESFGNYAQNIELLCFSDGLEVYEYLASSYNQPSPCLIVLDINLPRMSGKEVLKKLRAIKRFKDIRVVLFTTSSQPHDKAFAHFYGAGFMTKPITYKQMDKIIHQFIEHCTDEIKNSIRKEFS